MSDENRFDKLEDWGLEVCRSLITARHDEEAPTLGTLSDVIGMKLRFTKSYYDEEVEVVVVPITGVRVWGGSEGIKSMTISFPTSPAIEVSGYVDIETNGLVYHWWPGCPTHRSIPEFEELTRGQNLSTEKTVNREEIGDVISCHIIR